MPKTLALTSVALAAMIGSATFAAPASAGGWLSFTYVPTNSRDAQDMRVGLALYSLFSGIHKSGSISQHGVDNRAGLAQRGLGNTGVIHQEGRGHSATLRQNGNDNAYGVFQFGKNTNANVAQYGYGQTGATFQYGW
jgi:hypothetical protein